MYGNMPPSSHFERWHGFFLRKQAYLFNARSMEEVCRNESLVNAYFGLFSENLVGYVKQET